MGDTAAPLSPAFVDFIDFADAADFPSLPNYATGPEQTQVQTWQADHLGGFGCLRVPYPGLPGPVYGCGLCASSLDVAHLLATRGALPEWGSVLASAQSSGRGQLGRAWHSSVGNVFAALRLPASSGHGNPFAGPEAAPALGAFLAATLHDFGAPVLLKWPNDIVVSAPDGRFGELFKAGGILLEERGGSLMAGIGLNLASAPPPSALREGHALRGGLLRFSDTRNPDALALWLRLVGRIKFWYEQNLCPGTPWRSLAERFLAFQGREVGITDGPNNAIRLRGAISGLSPDGGLRLRSGSVTHTVHSGSLVCLS